MTRPYKTILVALNNQQLLKSNLDMAAFIADRFNSHVIGLYVIPSAIVYSAPYGYGGGLHYTDLNTFYKSKASVIEQEFEAYLNRSNLNGEWRCISSHGHFISETVVEHGREADLIILGHDSSIRIPSMPDLEFNAKVVGGCGRPVLVVPTAIRKNFRINKAYIGWDGSREAARAAFDAVPLLQMSKNTEVTSINPKKEREISGDLPGAELANSLARYDVPAEARTITTRKSVAKSLIDDVQDDDLLVIGAYGHSRLRQSILGGVTRRALHQMPCPVLMSN